MKEIEKPIDDPAYKKLFDVPLAWFEKNSFLRSVRYQYGRFGDLTEKQLVVLKKTLKEMKAKEKKA